MIRFMSRSKLETRENISFAIYQALVEIHTLRKKGSFQLEVSKKVLEQFYIKNSGRVCFRRKKTGATAIFYGDEEIQQEILNLVVNDRLPPESGHVDDSEGLENTALVGATSDLEDDSQAEDQEMPIDQADDLSSDEYQTTEDIVSQKSDNRALNLEINSPDLTQNSIHWLCVTFDDLGTKFAVGL